MADIYLVSFTTVSHLYYLIFQKSPVKVVHFADETATSDENINETNITVSISTSPRKKRKASATTHMLEKELNAEANRRNSLSTANAVGETANLTLMVSSLRRQNEDLKAKLAEASKHKRPSEGLGSFDKALIDRKEVEIGDLKKTITNLERLLSIERDERSANEKNTLQLLEDVKKKWNERDDKRHQMLKKDLEDANVLYQDMELELQQKSSDLTAAQNEIESLQSVKQSLKAKLKECKSKLEATVSNYEVKADQVERFEKKIETLEQELKSTKENEKKKRRISVIISENQAEVEALRDEMEKLSKQKRELESELSDLKLTSKLTANRFDSLQKEYDGHLARCDGELVKLSSENSKMNQKNEDLIKENSILEAKLKDKTRALDALEKMQESLESKIPTKESFEAYADEKVDELNKEIEELKKDKSLLKVEVRLAERKNKEMEGRISLYKDMYTDLKKKSQKDNNDEQALHDKVAELEKKVQEQTSAKEVAEEKNQRLQSRLDSVRKELEEVKAEAKDSKDLDREVTRLKEKLSSAEKNGEECQDYKKKYELTKSICLEIEEQVKQYEKVIEKLEETQEKLKKSSEDTKKKADDSAAELIKTKREINELKSTQAFKETKMKDLEEKTKEIEKYYETENSSWKTKFEESNKMKKDQTMTIVELKDQLHKLERDCTRATGENEDLHEQNNKLKEEMTTLITSFHSLKDSHLMLQNTVQELGDKLMARDEEIEKRDRKIASQKTDLDRKNVEHQETLNQLKKLTQHLPGSTPKKKDKSINPFLL